MTTETPQPPKGGATVILGAGIIGVSTAYYLSQQAPPSSSSTIHLVDPSPELFASASGFAGGFLARDWFAPAVSSLGALSFDEHRRLAEQEGGAEAWGYAASTSVSYAPVGRGSEARDGREGCGGGGGVADVWCREGGSRAAVASGVKNGEGKVGEDGSPRWLRRREGDELVVISDEGTVAQVDSLRLSQFLLQKCLSAGVQLHHPSRAISITTDPTTGALSGLVITSPTNPTTTTTLPCTNLVLAAGAWTPSVYTTLFPSSTLHLPITSLAGHSLVVEARSAWWSASAGCHALFLAHPAPSTSDGACTYAPEMFSRLGGSLYVAGLNSSAEPLPALPGDAKARISESALARLRGTAGDLLGEEEGDVKVLREGLCFRPVTARGTPIVGRVPPEGEKGAVVPAGVYVAAGHGPWGISMSLGTGKVVAEMVLGREALSAEVAGLGVEEACGMGR
ncbi:nucleotide-binding domain-containing protein [Camillea tinctor]|nr:nucleotide-binding domain-containing protein [Camillea tinctor]